MIATGDFSFRIVAYCSARSRDRSQRRSARAYISASSNRAGRLEWNRFDGVHRKSITRLLFHARRASSARRHAACRWCWLARRSRWENRRNRSCADRLHAVRLDLCPSIPSQRTGTLHRFDGHEQVWLFGYGSLIWKADFDYIERRPARIHGWSRRFWQGSHDHRGTPGCTGTRRHPGCRTRAPCCAGMAYLITPDVFDHLDMREKNGYLRELTAIEFCAGGSAEGLIYIAGPDNEAFLGRCLRPRYRPAHCQRQRDPADSTATICCIWLTHCARWGKQMPMYLRSNGRC